MSKTTPAFEYGFVLGSMQRLFEEAAAQMVEGFRAALSARRTVRRLIDSDPENAALFRREQVSIQRYNAAVARERRLGKRYVESLTDGLAKRWGL